MRDDRRRRGVTRTEPRPPALPCPSRRQKRAAAFMVGGFRGYLFSGTTRPCELWTVECVLAAKGPFPTHHIHMYIFILQFPSTWKTIVKAWNRIDPR